MAAPARVPEPLPPEIHRIEGLRDFQARVRSTIERVAERGDPQILLCDADFAAWPLGEPRVVAALERWARPRRRMLMLGASFDEIVRLHPRWVAWRRSWPELVECRSPSDVDPSQCPSLLLVPTGPITLRLHDRERFRGIWSSVPSDAVSAREAMDAAAERSVEAFAVTTLGL
ncbi:MAG: hypothetical protein Fur0039_19000 [Rhodocyclaceae bacterium]